MTWQIIEVGPRELVRTRVEAQCDAAIQAGRMAATVKTSVLACIDTAAGQTLSVAMSGWAGHEELFGDRSDLSIAVMAHSRPA